MKQPSLATIKRLFAVSRNQCAFPKCTVPLVDPHSGKVIARICHIKGQSPGGPRYDPNQTDEERHGFDNLILLCPVHHDVVDADPDAYTVERLMKMKLDHEDLSGDLPLTDEQAAQFIANMNTSVQVRDNTLNSGSIITTINQFGGQVAHQITNVGPQPRKMSPQAAGALVATLRTYPSESVRIVSLMGDAEAFEFAAALKSVLEQAGWHCEGIDQALYNGVPRGVVLKIEKETPGISALGNCLLRMGFRAIGQLNPSLSEVEIIVGANL